MSTNIRKVAIVAIIAVGAIAAVLVASSIVQATAQQERQKMMWSGEAMPQINGSVSVANETMDFINENINVTFAKASQTAQSQVENGRTIGGHMGVVQGFLVYSFFVADIESQTGHLVIVDGGNDEVLHTSEDHQMGSFGHYGHWGGHGGWHGHGMSHGGWGFWR